MLQVITRGISTFLIKRGGLTHAKAQTGTVTLIQRFGSAANLNIHLHCLMLEGVYRLTDTAPVFQAVPAAERDRSWLRSTIETGFWTRGHNVSIRVKVETKKGAEEYVNSYEFESEARSMVVPDGSGIDGMLNAGLGDVLIQMFTDKELLMFLSG